MLASSLNNLGGDLSNLGRRGDALKASQEAVDIRRTLADQNPQAFLPDLAMSLGAHGSALRGAERIAEAAAAFEEGVRALPDIARQLPQAFSELLRNLLRDYVAACQAAAQTPDAALVEAVAEVLGKDVGEAGTQQVSLPELLGQAVTGARAKSLEAEQFFELFSQMAVDPDTPDELKALGRVMKSVMTGEFDPALSALSDELAGQVREALEGG